MTRVVDTSVLFAALNADDAHHRAARETLADPEPVHVPTEVLVETVDLVHHRFGKEAAKQAAVRIRALPHVRIADKVDVDGVIAVHAAHRSLSLADAVVVQTGRHLAATVLTFDKKLQRAARAG